MLLLLNWCGTIIARCPILVKHFFRIVGEKFWRGTQQEPVQVDVFFLRKKCQGEIGNFVPFFDDGIVVRCEAELGSDLFVEDLGFAFFFTQESLHSLHDILEMDIPIYSTICVVRAEQTWPRAHPKDLPQLFLMTPRKFFIKDSLKFDLIADWAPEKYAVNEDDDPKEWWDVIDRTTGEFLAPEQWDYKNGIVTITDGNAFICIQLLNVGSFFFCVIIACQYFYRHAKPFALCLNTSKGVGRDDVHL